MKTTPCFSYRFVAVLTGVVCSLAGGVALIQWAFDNWKTITLGAGYVPMAPMTAILFVSLGLKLVGRQIGVAFPAVRSARWVVLGGVAAACVLELWRSIRPFDLPWDVWAFSVETQGGVLRVGVMSRATAGAFLLAVGAMVLSTFRERRWARRCARMCVAAGLLIAGVTVAAYVAGSPLDYRAGGAPMALLTALAFVVLHAGILAESSGDWPDGEEAQDSGGRDIGGGGRWGSRFLMAVVIVGLAGCGYVYLRNEEAQVREDVYGTLTSIADLKVSEIGAWRAERLADARLLSRFPHLADSVAGMQEFAGKMISGEAELLSYLRALRQAYGYRQIAILSPEGKALAAVPADIGWDQDMPSDLLARLKTERDVLIQDIHWHGDRDVRMNLFVPVRSRDEQTYVGVVVVGVSLETSLMPIIREWPLPDIHGGAILIRRRGNDVEYLIWSGARSMTEAERIRPITSSQLLGAKALREGPKGLMTGADYNGVTVLGVARRVPGSPWLLVTKMDKMTAYAPLRQETLVVFMTTGLIIVVGWSFLNGWKQHENRRRVLRQLDMERMARVADRRFELIMRHANDAILLFDTDRRIVEASERVVDLYGWTPGELVGRPVETLRASETAGRVPTDFEAALSKDGVTFETLHVRRDGTIFPVEVSSRPVDIEGQSCVLSIIRNISDRKAHESEISRLSRMFKVISEINMTLVLERDFDVLCRELCRLLVESGHFRTAWIGWHDPETRDLIPRFVHGRDEAFVRSLRLSSDAALPEGRGPSGTALREDRTCVCNDFITDPSTERWHDRALRSGFRSSIALPLHREGRAVGLLSVYAVEQGFFGEREVRLLEEAAGNISFALDVFAGEERRRLAEEELRKLSLAVEQNPASISITDLSGNIVYVNPCCELQTGYAAGELIGKNTRIFASGRTPPETYVDLWKTIQAGRAWRGELVNRRKDGSLFTEFTTIAPVVDANGRATHYMAIKEDITERLRSEERLRQLSRIVEQAPISIVITSLGGAILYANPTFLAVSGYALEEVLGKNPRVLKSGRTPDETYEVMWRTLTSGEVWSGELINRKKNGDLHTESVIIAPVLDDAGRTTNYVALKMDITEQKAAEDALRESEQRFRELFDLEMDAILVFDLENGRIIQANEAAGATYGLSVDTLLSMTIDRLFQDADSCRMVLTELQGRADKTMNIPLSQHRRGSGEFFPVALSMRAFVRQRRWLAVAVIRDITDQVRAHEQLARFNAELEGKVTERTEQLAARNREIEALLQAIPDLVMRMHRDGTLLNFQGSKGDSPLAALVRDSVPGALMKAAHDAGALALSGRSVVAIEARLPADGRPLEIELRASSIGHGEFVVFVRDITARKRFEAETAAMLEREREMSEMKTRFISVTSHEFRTPMAAAMVTADMLSTHAERIPPQKRTEMLGRIMQSLQRMNLMLDDLLLLNRMDAKRVTLRPAEFDLPGFVHQLVDEVRLADREAHRFEIRTQGDVARIVSDEDMLRHALTNLISNAVRYSPAGTEVVVDVRESDDARIRITVEDHGIGIPEPDRARIFESFERGSNVGQIKGTGLGLNIVKRMVALLGGDILLDSEVGRGSRFTIVLPRHIRSDESTT